MENKEEIYKNLSKLVVENNEPLVVVENGQPKSVVLPYDQYREMKHPARKSTKVKGMILAGGHATRLRPITYVTNKHLLPIFDRPMIYFPLQAFAKAGIKDVLITTNPEHAGDFINLLGAGEEFGLKLQYRIQKKPGGLAEAVSLAESFAEEDPLVVVLGDNIFDEDLTPAIHRFLGQGSGARIFGHWHPAPNQYGVIELGQDGKVLTIEEKPKAPKSNYAQIGIYMYYPEVFGLIKGLTPSTRGELEITDLNNLYLKRGDIYAEIWDKDKWWVDAGESPITLLHANQAAAERALQKKAEEAAGAALQNFKDLKF